MTESQLRPVAAARAGSRNPEGAERVERGRAFPCDRQLATGNFFSIHSPLTIHLLHTTDSASTSTTRFVRGIFCSTAYSIIDRSTLFIRSRLADLSRK